MFFGIASPDWKPGQSLSPVGSLLFRTRSEAAAFAPEATVVAVSLCFDSTNRAVKPLTFYSPALRHWSAPATNNSLGGITVFGPIPSILIRSSAAEASPSQAWENSKADLANGDFHGWDSLTMALLA